MSGEGMVGPNLGLDAVTIRWFRSGDLRWRSLVPMLEASLRGRTAPDALIIICGSNDLGRVTGVQLVGDMKNDINYLLLFLSHIFRHLKVYLTYCKKVNKYDIS